ncbi:MAG TPA: M48 family metalloprotease, partial [Gemmatimonadales bacterium]|nr:M48 family metalloprotease [Gemmatimonadales bacterium]
LTQLITLAASRQREALADATSVELTRNPVGLEQALTKIATHAAIPNVAGAAAHLFFEAPSRTFMARLDGLWSTHPPMIDRVNRLRALRATGPISEQQFDERAMSFAAAGTPALKPAPRGGPLGALMLLLAIGLGAGQVGLAGYLLIAPPLPDRHHPYHEVEARVAEVRPVSDVFDVHLVWPAGDRRFREGWLRLDENPGVLPLRVCVTDSGDIQLPPADGCSALRSD